MFEVADVVARLRRLEEFARGLSKEVARLLAPVLDVSAVRALAVK
jgi:hypothetical protein